MKGRFPATILLATSIALTLSLGGPAAGQHDCTPSDESGLSLGGWIFPPTGPEIPRKFYVALDLGAPDMEMTGIALYEESNGFAGVQRQDARDDGTCGGAIDPDTLLLFV